MKNVVILMQGNGSPSTVMGPYEVFNSAGVTFNRMLGRKAEKLFNVQLASITGDPVTFQGGVSINAMCSLENLPPPDIVIIGSCGPDFRQASKNKKAINWLKSLPPTTLIASICTGLALLAETGLLEDKRATTHWAAVDKLRKKYPSIKVEADQLFVEQDNIVTGGGSYAANDLALYLVDKYYGDQVKQECAKAIVLDCDRSLQTNYSGLQHLRMHDDEQVHLVQDYIEENFSLDIRFEELARKSCMSLRNFHRKFKKATGITPLSYLQKQRVEAAKMHLEKSTESIDLVAIKVGYQDTNYFRRIFKKQTSYSPAAYRDKYAL